MGSCSPEFADGHGASGLSNLEFAVLSDLSDDDYWLYEILWFINGQCPDLDHTQRLLLAQQTVQRLHDLGLIGLAWFDARPQPMRALTAKEASTEIERASNWDPASSMAAPPFVGCGVTDAGWSLYTREFARRPRDRNGPTAGESLP